jgi:hypothetical protein
MERTIHHLSGSVNEVNLPAEREDVNSICKPTSVETLIVGA